METILCHCRAGVSRSAACAFILKCLDVGPGKEYDVITELGKSRPIYPNQIMIYFAQEILGNKWKLVWAYNKWLEDQILGGWSEPERKEIEEDIKKIYPDIPILESHYEST